MWCNMYIFKECLKIKLKRLCSSRLIETCVVSIKKCSTTCFVWQPLRASRKILDGVITEASYFRHCVTTDPSFADIFCNESILQENAKSTNELVVFLRNMAQDTDTARDGSNQVETSLYSTFDRASYTLLDLIEIFYFITYFDYNLGGLSLNKLIRIFNQHIRRIRYESSRRMLTLFLLIAHDKRISIPYKWKSRLVNDFSSLTKSELIAALYVLSQDKFQIKSDSKLAALLMTHLKEMTVNEVATTAWICFILELRLGAGVGEILLSFLVENFEHLNCIQVGAICKCIYLMHDKYDWVKVNELYEKAFPASDRFTTATLIHLASLKADKNFFPSQYMDVLKERLMRDTKPRIKDLERFLMIKVKKSSDLLDSDFLNFIDETVSKLKEDWMLHPRAFISLVHYLVILNVFKEDWINFIFSLKYISKLCKSLKKYGNHELCSIDCSLELERPSYKGNRYPYKMREALLKKNYLENYSGMMGRRTSEVKCLLIEIFGSENVICRNILPHFPYPYSLMCFENGREPIPILTAENDGLVKWIWKEWEKGKFFVPNFPEFRSDSWLVFVIKSAEVTVDGENLNLLAQCRLRQLKALGLNPVMVDYGVMEKFETNEMRKHYVVNIVNEAVNSIINAREAPVR